MSDWVVTSGPLPTIVHEAIKTLELAGIDQATADAKRLWTHAQPRRYVDYEEDHASEAIFARFEAYILRRAAHEPVSHITGKRAFWESSFEVTADVLDPRPDTETLVEAALLPRFETVLDLGTGSGCILLSLLKERREARGVGSDISVAALAVAKQNAQQLEVNHQAQFVQSDWFANVTGRFDLIVSNPPYITADAFETLAPEVKNYEPKLALTPGGDGLDAYRIICSQAGDFLTQGGHLMMEIGHDQGASVSALFEAAGFADIRVLPDINGKDRVIAANLR